MDREQAKRLIIETFESSFDKERFSNFIVNLLKTYNREKALGQRQGIQGVTERFVDFISSWERLGRYIDEEGKIIDILVLEKREKIEKGEIKGTKYEYEIPESIVENAKTIYRLLDEI